MMWSIWTTQAAAGPHHRPGRQPKVAGCAGGACHQPRCITTLQQADEALLDTWVPQASVVLDYSDNYTTRHVVNVFASAMACLWWRGL